MSEFTASNGVTIHAQGPVTDRGQGVVVDGYFLSPNDVSALREFFEKENDDRLDRWRWPENPDYVVYPWGDVEDHNTCIAIVDERKGGQVVTFRSTISGSDEWARAARAYFDAHPGPKPWDAAEDNEIWVLTGAGGLELPWRRTGDGEWESITPKAIRRRNVDLITAGRRIWPEVAS